VKFHNKLLNSVAITETTKLLFSINAGICLVKISVDIQANFLIIDTLDFKQRRNAMESRRYQRNSALILAIWAIMFSLFVMAPEARASEEHDLNLSASNQMVVRTGAYRTIRTIGNTISSKMGPAAMSLVAAGPNQGFKSASVPALFDSGQSTEAFTTGTDLGGSLNSTTGLSSGGELASHGLWVSVSPCALDNTFISTKYDGSLFLGMIGYDHRVNKNLLLGTALGCETTDIDTKFNNGTVNSGAFTVSPYAAFRIFDFLSIDVILSYSSLDYDTERPTTFLGPATGSYDADRFMVSSNLNYYYLTGNWNFNARFGYMYTKEDADGFTESNMNRVQSEDTKIGEFQIGGKVGYFINKFELFIGAYYIYDSTMTKTTVPAGQRRPANDKSEVEAVAGINLFAYDTINVGAEVSTSLGREDVDNTSLLVNISFAF
jgi:Autotransporter beta-domain